MSKQKVLAILAVVVVVVLVIVSISLGAKYNDVVAKLEAEKAAKTETQLQLDAVTAQLTEVQTSLEDAEVQLGDISVQLTDAQAAVEAAETLLAEETLAKEKAEKAVMAVEAELTAELEATAAKEVTLTAQLDELEATLAAKVDELETAAAQEEILTAQITELETELSARESEMGTVKAELEAALAQNETDHDAIAEYEEVVASLTSKKNELEGEIALLNEALEGYKAESGNAGPADVAADAALYEAESIGIALVQPEGAAIEEVGKEYFGDTAKVVVTIADGRVIKITCIDGVLTVLWEGAADATINEVISSIVVR